MRDKLHLFGYSLNSLASCHLKIISRVCFGTYVCETALPSQEIKVGSGEVTKTHTLFAFLVPKLMENHWNAMKYFPVVVFQSYISTFSIWCMSLQIKMTSEVTILTK